ncbi:MAG: V-type ATP synthase subunit E [Candidatus Muirbacterium halophilum]|nr:V-type ATP synthase subunit E [Candidatus Muirbacterium halophilum]MCK9477846.1 V-type ATP synthase subunit E [Candidatus Muirbacterium halophilum]
MSVKDIIEEIGKISDFEIKKIEEETDKELKQIKEKNSKIVEDKRNLIKKAIDTKAKELKNGIVTREKLSMRNKLLSEKQSVVSRLFDNVKEKLIKLEGDKVVSFYADIMKNSDIPQMDYEVIRAESFKNLDQNVVNQISEKTGVKMTLSSNTCSGEGGFIIKADYLELDFRLEAILKTMRINKESEIVKILFG